MTDTTERPLALRYLAAAVAACIVVIDAARGDVPSAIRWALLAAALALIGATDGRPGPRAKAFIWALLGFVLVLSLHRWLT